MYGDTKLLKATGFCWTFVCVVAAVSQGGKAEPVLSYRNDRLRWNCPNGGREKKAKHWRARLNTILRKLLGKKKKNPALFVSLGANDAHVPYPDAVVILASLWQMMIKHNILVQVCQLYQILIVVISLKLPSFLIPLFIIYCYFSYFLAIDLIKWVFAFPTLMESVLLCLCQPVLVSLWVQRCVFVFRKKERLIISLLNRPCLPPGLSPPGVVSKRLAASICRWERLPTARSS